MNDHLRQFERTATFAIYVLFAFGGIWHVLGVFQHLMRFLAAPLLISVSLLLFYTVYRSVDHSFRSRFSIWLLVILIVGWGIEYCGVETHFPFGSYWYGNALQPQILNIPIAIGFAWFSICLSSILMSHRMMTNLHLKPAHQIWLAPFMSAAFMLFFDIIMEQAAPKLDYWIWQNGAAPLTNYVSWFVLGYGFSFLFQKMRISLMRYSAFGIHVYLSQFLYFLLVILKP